MPEDEIAAGVSKGFDIRKRYQKRYQNRMSGSDIRKKYQEEISGRHSRIRSARRGCPVK